MKTAPPQNKSLIALSAFLLSAAGLHAQAFTSPVGYVTHTLKAGQFNLIGLTVHNPIEVTGDFESVSGTTLVDNDASFNTVLTAGSTYILEVTSGSLTGTIQEFEWTANSSPTTLVTSDNLGSDGLSANDTYQIRRAATISDIFGATNDRGLLGGTASSIADNIYIPNAQSGFDIYFYSTGGFFGTGWRRVGDNSVDHKDQPIFMTDGFYIFKTVSDLEFVVSGAVKVEAVDLALTQEFTFLSGVFPVGSTLASSLLGDSLVAGTASAVSDNILIQQSDGTFSTYYFSTGGFFGVGWRLVGGGTTDQSNVDLPSAFVIRRVSNNDVNVGLSAPAGYDSL